MTDRVEWCLIATAVVTFLTGAVLLAVSPGWWGWYIQVLDPWYWSWRAWTIAVAVLVELLVIIRFLAKNRKAAVDAGRLERSKRILASVVLLAAVVSIVESTIPWTEVDYRWYWVRICWYWRSWWVKASVIALLVAILLLLLGVRVRVTRLREKADDGGIGLMKIRIRVPSVSIEWLLVAAIAAMLVILAWPMIEAWRNRPRPGVQVCRQEDNAGYANYLLYLPREYDPSGKWPLLVYLHGSAECGDVNAIRQLGPPHQIELGNDLPFIVVSPQCPWGSRWIPERVVKLIEHVGRRFAVDADRVYLTGYSMGGCGAWETACFDPERFAAIVPVAGGGDVAQAEGLVKLPIWAFHGAEDEVVPPEASGKMVDAVRRCGGQVNLTMLPDTGHGICDRAYRESGLCDWLLAQRRHSSTEGERK